MELIDPSADTIEDKIASRYSLVVIAAKRAKQLKEGAPLLIETASTNPLTIALQEIAAGKVGVAEPEGLALPPHAPGAARTEPPLPTLSAAPEEPTAVGAHAADEA